MSLDVYLSFPPAARQESTQRIFIREDGRTREITRAEWDERFPDREPVVATVEDDFGEVFSWNVTHNLGRMAREAGVYEALWRPTENGWDKAGDLIEPLTDGLARLQTFPDRYREFNPENQWGSYEGLIEFVAAYLAACLKWPDASVRVWK